MNKLIKNTLLLSFLCFGVAQAAVEKEDNSNPPGCEDVGYKFELQTLHILPGEADNEADKQSMYILFNHTQRSLNLYQMRDEDSSRSMYLNHVIDGRQWAVLSTSEKLVKFICTVPDSSSQYGKIVDCGESLRVCEYTKVRYGLNNRGNYWLVNSNTRNGAVNGVVRYGIIPSRH